MLIFDEAKQQQFKVMQQAVEAACKELKISTDVYKKTFRFLAQDVDVANELKRKEHEIRMRALTTESNKVF